MEHYFTEYDSYLFHQGTHYSLYKKMGAHLVNLNGVEGVMFVLWAPHAMAVCVISDGNGWTPWSDNMTLCENGVWELFLPGMTPGTRYKYLIKGARGKIVEKTDPYGFSFEKRPGNAAIVCEVSNYAWGDSAYMSSKASKNYLAKPMSVYEVHLGSWKKDYSRNDGDYYKNYRSLARELAEYVKYMGYTHIELMGICEYPYDPSWGYQVTGYFAPTARYGTPDDFKFFVDYMHKNGIGVILDWVPAHFPKDSHSLGMFDGTHLYEPNDKLLAEYPEWGTYSFNYARCEVTDFLISSALFWVKEYHIDALRTDAVAAMLYRSFGREQWSPNKDGGNINYESIEFLRHLNSLLMHNTTSFMIAEDSSILPGITKSADEDGLGFGLKWNMGWMNDTLRYLSLDPVYRKYHHGLMTHTSEYAFDEHYMLVLSHDEVVYGKGTLYGRIPGDVLEKIGCLKTYFTMMYGHPGKKLLFMGQDFAQINEWDYKSEIDWYLADDGCHRDIMDCLRRLLVIYKNYRVLYDDSEKDTFEWISRLDADRSIFSFIRKNPDNYCGALYFVCNFNPVNRKGYAMGLPEGGSYRRIFTTYPSEKEVIYTAEKELCDGREYRLPFDLRPYESVIFEKV